MGEQPSAKDEVCRVCGQPAGEPCVSWYGNAMSRRHGEWTAPAAGKDGSQPGERMGP